MLCASETGGCVGHACRTFLSSVEDEHCARFQEAAVGIVESLALRVFVSFHAPKKKSKENQPVAFREENLPPPLSSFHGTGRIQRQERQQRALFLRRSYDAGLGQAPPEYAETALTNLLLEAPSLLQFHVRTQNHTPFRPAATRWGTNMLDLEWNVFQTGETAKKQRFMSAPPPNPHSQPLRTTGPSE